jgi:hypothetical protein
MVTGIAVSASDQEYGTFTVQAPMLLFRVPVTELLSEYERPEGL